MATTVFHIEGGIGKNVAATAVTAAYKKSNPKRKIIVVSAWPEAVSYTHLRAHET